MYYATYVKLKSFYDARVASATTARDFAMLWLLMFSGWGVPCIVLSVVSFILFGELPVGCVVLFFCISVFLISHVLGRVFGDADVRFWDPRAWLPGEHSNNINIEKVRELHADESCTHTLVDSQVEGVAIFVVITVLFALPLLMFAVISVLF